MAARGVIDDVAAGTARGATLKSDELGNQAIITRQHDAAGVQQRQQIDIAIGLGAGRGLVANAVTVEGLAGEAAGIAVAVHRRHAVRLEQCAELVDDGNGRERRLAFSYRVDDGVAVTIAMSNSNSERIGAGAAGGVDRTRGSARWRQAAAR